MNTFNNNIEIKDLDTNNSISSMTIDLLNSYHISENQTSDKNLYYNQLISQTHNIKYNNKIINNIDLYNSNHIEKLI